MDGFTLHVFAALTKVTLPACGLATTSAVQVHDHSERMRDDD